MTALETIRESVRVAFDGSLNPALLWSAQKDSTLLLFLAREVRPDIGIIWFRSALTKEQTGFGESLIAQYGLTVHSWLPAERRVYPTTEGMSLVEEYSFGGFKLPIVSDISHGARCIGDLPRQKVPFVDVRFDRLLIGVKDSDSHSVLGESWRFPADGLFCAPLRNLTDAEVWEATRELNIPFDREIYEYDAPDGPIACTNCLSGTGEVYCPASNQMIDAIHWNPAARLSEFRAQLNEGAK